MTLATLIGYVAVYAVVFGAGIYYLRRVILQGPDPIEHAPGDDSARPKRPLSAVNVGFDGQAEPARS
jgi:cytochrome d ubiquinol oxidase subunit I